VRAAAVGGLEGIRIRHADKIIGTLVERTPQAVTYLGTGCAHKTI
jgi:hypothetical protein